jgi:hypothetical protein
VDNLRREVKDIEWLISIGDLIKVVTYSVDNYGKVSYGIVIAKEEENQLFLFPSVDVYMFGSQKITTFPAGRVEVISGKYL